MPSALGALANPLPVLRHDEYRGASLLKGRRQRRHLVASPCCDDRQIACHGGIGPLRGEVTHHHAGVRRFAVESSAHERLEFGAHRFIDEDVHRDGNGTRLLDVQCRQEHVRDIDGKLH